MTNIMILRALLMANGIITTHQHQAASMESIPILESLLDVVPLCNDKPPPEQQEGSGCGTCSKGCANGCGDGCQSGCPSGCTSGCLANML